MSPSKCKDIDKIRNPISDKCILMRGKVCQNLLKNPSVKFDAQDIKKLRNAGYHVIQTQQQQISSQVLVDQDSTFSKVKKYIQKFLKDYKSFPKYLDSHHEKYCKKKSNTSLIIPVEKYSISYNIPIDFALIREKNVDVFTKYLNTKSQIPFQKTLTNIFSMYFNNYNEKNALVIFNKDYEIPGPWINAINNYIRSLSKDDMYTILGYSYHSFDFINSYLRGMMNKSKLKTLLERHVENREYFFPFYIQVFRLLPTLLKDNELKTQIITINSENKSIIYWIQEAIKRNREHAYFIILKIQVYFPYDFWIHVMEQFKTDLHRIIDNSPPVTETITIYRGVNKDYFLNGEKNQYYKNNTFVSCSLNPYHSIKYTQDKCCLKRISILRGSKALLIAGLSHYNEYEILLNVNSVFYIHQKKTYSIYSIQRDSLNDICFHDNTKRKIQMIDIIVSDK